MTSGICWSLQEEDQTFKPVHAMWAQKGLIPSHTFGSKVRHAPVSTKRRKKQVTTHSTLEPQPYTDLFKGLGGWKQKLQKNQGT